MTPLASTRAKIVLGVTGGWLVVGVVWAIQNSIGAGLQSQSLPLASALRTALIQSLPWIPVTLAVIWLSLAVPLGWPPKPKSLAIHLVAAVAVAYLANIMVVLGYWTLGGGGGTVSDLVTSAARWTAIRLHFSLLIYAAIAGVTLWVRFHRATRERELQLARIEGQLARARLEALTAQIRPHFLLNTLHTMGQLWRSGRSDEADRVLDHLGRLFHKVQDSTARTEIPMEEEIEMVTDYLAIEATRFRDRLRAEVRVDQTALGCRVPPLILQPLVENAVRHGISATSTAGRLQVGAAVREGVLEISVVDDGPGIDAPTRSPGSGTGLRNTRERLKQLYGDRASLVIDGSTTNGDRSDGTGTTILLRMPARGIDEGADD
ncbi:MAG: sensor histidine kinase [Gemmatimonadales bacterium]